MSLRRVAVIAFGSYCVLRGASVGAADIYGRVYDTLERRALANARIVLGTQHPLETITDKAGRYSFRRVQPGAYPVRILIPGERDAVGRLVVSARAPTIVANFDLGAIEAPGHDF
ncbi:MAG TPA: carboxypeptidase-like regulatory domain-containing protein [Burkholderiales bacterium]|nr:carboxypeptidase-like regulatory domain-containing protein [Burkholderiales bacterium]